MAVKVKTVAPANKMSDDEMAARIKALERKVFGPFYNPPSAEAKPADEIKPTE